ncbi:hypothetical protein [Orenia marismortui]|uniref:hypothetical protein n=1 Tax=Orenia marismortui TaxID=46469 RepID=UPI00036ACFE7|nr:hypothetical protein [Orenia marismortui]
MNNKFKKFFDILKFKRFMKPFLIMFGIGFFIIGFGSLISNVRTFSDFLRFLLEYGLMIIGTLIFLKIFELIAALIGAGKIYNSMFKKRDKDSNQNK